MYDPKVARFLQEDTYTGDINDPLSLNLYTYCHNEPLMYTDPTGHSEYAYISGIGVAKDYYKKEYDSVVQLDKLLKLYDSESTNYYISLQRESNRDLFTFNNPLTNSLLNPSMQGQISDSYKKLYYTQYLMLQNEALQQDEYILNDLKAYMESEDLIGSYKSDYYRQILLSSNPRNKRILENASKDELIKAGKQMLLRGWTKEEDITELGTVAESAVDTIGGFTGLDFAMDVSDITSDIANWKWSWGHAGQTTFHLGCLLPGLGGLKGADKTRGLIKASDSFGGIKGISNIEIPSSLDDISQQAREYIDSLDNVVHADIKNHYTGVGKGGNKPDATKHSTYRKDVTGRPTGTVVNDIQTARPKDILIEDNGNIIVRGSNGRVQVLSPDGQRHITTLTRTDANVKSLINQGRYRYSSYEEAENIINMYKK